VTAGSQLPSLHCPADERTERRRVFFTYLARELRRRSRQAAVVAIGLGIGIGLVVTVSSASAGVKSAQTQVLHSLYGVGTDMTVTETPSTSTFGPQRFGGFAGGTRPTGPFSQTHVRTTPGSSTIAQSRVTEVGHLQDVNAATGGLSLTETAVSGTFGSSGSGPSSSTGTAPSFNFNSTSISGVQPTDTGVGLLSASDVTKGRYFKTSENDAKVAIVSSTYAKDKSLSVGSTVDVDGTSLRVIGIATPPSSSTSTDLYVPLGEAQTLAGIGAKVTTIYVSVNSASNVSTVQSEIKKLMPSATVTTSADLANEVTGSLSSASSLATDLGRWLAIAALLASFLVAALLMLAAVSRRVREFGTLKAIGWRTRRVTGQVMGEGLVQGAIGAVLGLVLGLIGVELVSAFAPTLTATVGPSFATGQGNPGGGTFPGGEGFRSRPGGFAGSGPGGGFANRFADLSHTVLVHLTAPIQGGTLGIAIGLALVGGLLAGTVGAWRAARMSPAEALRQVG